MVDIEFQTLDVLGTSLAFLANVKPFTQTAVASKTQVFPAAKVLQWLELKAGVDADAEDQAARPYRWRSVHSASNNIDHNLQIRTRSYLGVLTDSRNQTPDFDT